MNEPMKRSALYWAYLMLLAGVCGHASSEFVAKLTGVVGPELTVWRFMIGGIGLVTVSLVWPSSRNLFEPLRRDGLVIVALSILGMTAAQLLFHWALDYATVIQVATLVTTMPIIVVVVNRIVNKVPISTPKLISGLGALAGVIFLITDGYLSQVLADASVIGMFLALSCGALGAIYIVLSKPYFVKYGAIRMTTYTFALGFFVLWPFVGMVWGIWVDPMTLFDRPMDNALAILTLGVWNTTIGFVLWLGGLALVPDTGRANYMFFLKPVIAAFLAVWILNEPITLAQGLAILAVTGCVAAEVFWEEITGMMKRRAKA